MHRKEDKTNQRLRPRQASGHNAEAGNLEIDWARVAHDNAKVGTENYSVSLPRLCQLTLHLLCSLIHAWLPHSIPPSILPFIPQRFQVRMVYFVLFALQQSHAFCATVSRPLLSVGQLKAMLVWHDSSPCLIACFGGSRYILLEASVMHHLPVVSRKETRVLIEAVHCFTESH